MKLAGVVPVPVIIETCSKHPEPWSATDTWVVVICAVALSALIALAVWDAGR